MKVQEINRNINSKKAGRNKKHNKKRLLWLKFLLAIIAFLSALILLALSPLFNINRIDVEGNQHYKSEDIASAANIVIGSNGFKTIGNDVKSLLLLRDGKAEKNILDSHPYIKEVKVKFNLPDKILISIWERTPVCLVPYHGTYLILDREGYVLDASDNVDKNGLPQVKGFKFDRYELGKELKVDNPDKFDALFKVIDTVESSDKESSFKMAGIINYIDVSDLSKVYLLLDSRIMVNLGGLDDLNYKVTFLKQIYQMNLKKSDKGLLDFTMGKNPRFMPENEHGN
ncbi:MAG: FtsQ-type POTRA domain-containing protein [Clostridiales bacterium]|nr:FtsQ-type POTRA domain-containing protein [Eubacteriales bacterium]MDH7564979.1 FtsQ-type POTRA domain-containing protein [Clostridiales bacterium]